MGPILKQKHSEKRTSNELEWIRYIYPNFVLLTASKCGRTKEDANGNARATFYIMGGATYEGHTKLSDQEFKDSFNQHRVSFEHPTQLRLGVAVMGGGLIKIRIDGGGHGFPKFFSIVSNMCV